MGGVASQEDKEVSWVDMTHQVSDNGLILSGKRLPEELLEQIIAFSDLKDFSNITLVCSVWKSLTTKRSFWKTVYDIRGSYWASIPEDLKIKKDGWAALCVGIKRNIFFGNLVANPSGENGIDSWTLETNDRVRLDNARSMLVVESPPVGTGSLPVGLTNSCFATSYVYISLSQEISLGFSSKILKLITPCEFRFSILTSTRFDCGGHGHLRVVLEDGNRRQVINQVQISLREREDWTSYSFCAFFDGQEDFSHPVFRFSFGGKDSRFWAGHYGLKFSRASAEVKLLAPDEPASEEFPRTTVSFRTPS